MIVTRDTGFYIASHTSSLSVSVRSIQVITINFHFFTALSNFVSVIPSTEMFYFWEGAVYVKMPIVNTLVFEQFHSGSFSGNVCLGVLILADVIE